MLHEASDRGAVGRRAVDDSFLIAGLLPVLEIVLWVTTIATLGELAAMGTVLSVPGLGALGLAVLNRRRGATGSVFA